MTKVWIRRGCAALGVSLIVALLCGCVNLGIDSQFNADGSVRYTVSVAIDNTALDQLNQFGGVDTSFITNQDQARQLAEQNGFEYEPIETADQTGAKFSKTYPDGADIGAAISELYSVVQGQGADGLPSNAFVGTFSQNADDWTFNLTVDSGAVIESFGVGANSPITPDQLGQYLDFTYTATFPGTVEDTNGTKLSDTRVQWNLPLDGSTTLTANGSNNSGSSGSIWLIAAIVAGVVIVGVVVAGYLLATRRRTTPDLDVAPIPAAATDPALEPAPAGLDQGSTPQPIEPAPEPAPDPQETDTTREVQPEPLVADPATEKGTDPTTPSAEPGANNDEEPDRIPTVPGDQQ